MITCVYRALDANAIPQGVVPDIVTMAKGIGNGLPLAAVVTTPEIAATLATRLHFNTYGGNPVCSAGGRAVLRVVDKDRTMENCATVGAFPGTPSDCNCASSTRTAPWRTLARRWGPFLLHRQAFARL
jgi:Aminotransferase class-III